MAQQDTLTTLIALGGAYFFITEGGKGTLPSGIQKLYNQLLGPPTGGSAPAAGGSSAKPSAADIAQNAAGLSIPTCVIQGFVNENGVLPKDIPTLDTWGDSTGRHNSASGSWSCKPTDSGPTY